MQMQINVDTKKMFILFAYKNCRSVVCLICSSCFSERKSHLNGMDTFISYSTLEEGLVNSTSEIRLQVACTRMFVIPIALQCIR